MTTRLFFLVGWLAFSSCYEAIQHQPVVDAGPPCSSDDECACGERCVGSDAGHTCTAYQVVTCVDFRDCASPHCVPTHRGGHGCGYSECQP